MTPEERRRFDAQLESVLAELPRQAIDRLDEVPLVVEDYPSRQVRDELNVETPDALCGLYTGVPLTDRNVDYSGVLPDQITVYRLGVLRASADDRGRVTTESLRRQIRITILHEVGHHFGLDEDDLAELGYD